MRNKSNAMTMLKEAGILFSITLIAGLLLGVVYELTKEPIRIQQEKAIQEACEAAFPVYEEDVSGVDGYPRFLFDYSFEYTFDEIFLSELAADGVKIGTIYTVIDNFNSIKELPVYCGHVVEVTSKNGYGGDIVLYVGVDFDGTVRGVSILELSETAGLGMEAPKVLAPQFAGRNVESFVYTKTGAQADNEVDAITSATITTSAVVNAVNGGLRTVQYIIGHSEQTVDPRGGGVNE